MEHYIHGSEDSLDVDVFFVVDNLHSLTNDEQKKLCVDLSTAHGPTSNGNLITIKDGYVSNVYKGTVDEVNNSLLATYHLHHQSFPLPIKGKVERDYALKGLRTLRGVLSHCSRTQYRTVIKEALRSEDLASRIKALDAIQFAQISDFSKTPAVEVYKFMAFQLAQSLALLRDGIEIYTKKEAADWLSQFDSRFVDMIYRREVTQSDAGIISVLTLMLAGALPTTFSVAGAMASGWKILPTKFGNLSVKKEKYV